MVETGSTRHRRPAGALRLTALMALLVIALGPSAGATPGQEESPEPTNATAAPFAVQPSGPDGPGTRDYFVYSLTPGETFGDTVAVSNLGDRAINFVIYPADAFNVRDEGGFTAARDGEPSTDVGSWLTLAAETYRVEPGQRIDVPFSITVPQDAEPGDHAGAILATDADRGSIGADSDDPNLQVRERVGARVYVRVEGPIAPAVRIDRIDVEHDSPSFAVPFFSSDGSARVTWEITNTGNVRLTPTAQLRVKGLFGRTIRTIPAQELPELLPGSNLVRSAVVTGLPPLEKLSVELAITADELEVVGASSYWVVPWRFVALLALLLAALAALRWRRRRRAAPPSAPPSSEPREMVLT
jgi:hypothetical protein